MTALSLCLVLVLSLSAAAATGCATCTVRSQLRILSLNHIKQKILSSLGFSAAPNISGRALPVIPPLQRYIDERSMQSDAPGGGNDPFPARPGVVDDLDDHTATIEKVYAFAQPQPKVRHRKGLETLNFKFSDRMLGSRVVNAKLWLHLRPTESTGSVVVSVRRELPPSSSSSAPYVSHKEMRSRAYEGKWIMLDVRRFVAEWFKNPKDNMGVSVHTTVSGQIEHPQRIIDLSTQSDETSFVPFLEVHVSEDRKHRIKRNVGLDCDDKNDEKRCCRYPLTVDFEEFGWDWIIAPKKYEANYCSGECPMVYLQKYPHTHIVSMVVPPGSSGPCCAPRKMSSISMLYFDQEVNIVYGVLPGMVVDMCGCS
ncbi:hypothetical protein GE061_016839 [Apolygus lucorum]|uniref:TGF-beta family profile domain-containing protein n=1 Tax=Apolygus lucorum TaxID=248454 RepID=A0A8S9XLC5_APOLU|nr:hypothetical protein GE061_016839 [Apolygus lucorum]